MPVPVLRAANRSAASALPDPWPALRRSKFGVQFFQGQLYMLAGPPGAGKTMLALDAAIKMNVPTLYVSADSDELTMAVRAACAVSHHNARDVRKTMARGMFKDVYGEALKGSLIRFEFDPSNPSITDIGHMLEAYHEVEGQYPRLLVVDTLMNVEGGSDNEWASIRQTAKDFHWLARKTKACLLVLHHTSEQNSDWILQAPPRSAIQGKVSQLPSVIVTVANRSGEMFLAVVKNRFGQADPGASEPLRFIVDMATVRVWDEPMMGERINGGFL